MTFSKWWTLSAGMVESDKEESGVYELADDNENVIYIGRADNIKSRMGDHVNEKDNDCIKKTPRNTGLTTLRSTKPEKKNSMMIM